MKSAVPARSALEVGFPATMLSEVGTKESWRKEIHRPATSTHKWWAKRLGTVFRGIICSAFTPAGDDAAATYGQALDLSHVTILDPFSGSGVTGVEAVKLGAQAICFDINPVATLVSRQALQPWDMTAMTHAYAQVEAASKSEVDRLHRTEDGRTVLYYFWVARVDCPECQVPVRLFDSPVFSRNAYAKKFPKAQVVCPQCLAIHEDRYDRVHYTCGNGHHIPQTGAVRGQRATCAHGHDFKVLAALGKRRPDYEMYAKMVLGPKGSRTYEVITDWDRALYAECTELLASLPEDAVLPSGHLLSGNNTDQALKWNFTDWRHFFNDRQLLSLSFIATAIRDLPGDSVEREALCALFSGTLEFNNLFASFKGEGTGAVRHMFSHHVLKPERTPLEAHPWGTPYSSGSFSTLHKSRLQRAHQYKTRPIDLVINGLGAIERVDDVSRALNANVASSWQSFDSKPEEDVAAYVATRDSSSTDLPIASVDLVVTDPPYMDNVHYAELADFFHAWLREMRPHVDYSDATSTRQVGEVQNADPKLFGEAIERVWSECARVLKPGGILAFTYHQARFSGWIELIKSLRRAGFIVTAVQPVKGEMSTSVVKAGAREPSNLDSVVVCRRVKDCTSTPHSSLEDALTAAHEALSRLVASDVAVGVGDIRSVVRGSLLAHIAITSPELDDEVVSLVDERADQMIETLLPAMSRSTTS